MQNLDQIHIWTVKLDVAADHLEEIQAFLTPADMQRAARFRHQTHAGRWMAARVALRVILGKYADVDPRELVLETPATGKPYLVQTSSAGPLCFNLSHAQDVATIAITRIGEVGIDVEHLPDYTIDNGFAAEVLSDEEMDAFLATSAEQRHVSFIRSWTRKEACLKAIGCGLSKSLKNVLVTVDADGALYARILDQPSSAPWHLVDFRVTPTCFGTVAIASSVRPEFVDSPAATSLLSTLPARLREIFEATAWSLSVSPKLCSRSECG